MICQWLKVSELQFYPDTASALPLASAPCSPTEELREMTTTSYRKKAALKSVLVSLGLNGLLAQINLSPQSGTNRYRRPPNNREIKISQDSLRLFVCWSFLLFHHQWVSSSLALLSLLGLKTVPFVNVHLCWLSHSSDPNINNAELS